MVLVVVMSLVLLFYFFLLLLMVSFINCCCRCFSLIISKQRVDFHDQLMVVLLGFFSYHLLPRPGFELTSIELHPDPGLSEGRSTRVFAVFAVVVNVVMVVVVAVFAAVVNVVVVHLRFMLHLSM